MIAGPALIALGLAAGGAAIVIATGQGTRTAALVGLGVAVVAILGLGEGALLPLAVFVLVGGALTRLGRGRKEAAGTAEPAGGRRGTLHVVAKLGLPALLGVVGLLGDLGRGPAVAYAAALAGALADTAGTEVGPLGGGSVFGFRGGSFGRLQHGSPGGMSLAGLAASVAGACAVAWSALLSGLIHNVPTAGIVAAAGVGASILESVVGGFPLGKGLGHFGRNVLVSVVSASVGFGAAACGWGTR